jgi:ribosomal protein L40E
MGRNHPFPLPEMPGVCLACGARGPLTPTEFVYAHTSKTSAVITVLALFAGVLYTRQMVYRLELPVCGVCLPNVRWAKHVRVVGMVLFLPVAVASMFVSTFYFPLALALPAYGVSALAYYLVVRTRGTPKASRLDGDHLTLSVPGYGQFVIFDRAAAVGQARPAARPVAHAGPRLNRSVCEGCGFINFPGVPECKKCRAPLAQTAAA